MIQFCSTLVKKNTPKSKSTTGNCETKLFFEVKLSVSRFFCIPALVCGREVQIMNETTALIDSCILPDLGTP